MQSAIPAERGAFMPAERNANLPAEREAFMLADRNANLPAERGANIPADPPGELVLPLIRPYFGGAVVGRVADNILRVSYSGRQPCGDRELGELFAAVGEYLAAARNARWIVEKLCLEAEFVDSAEEDDEGDEDGEGWGDEE